MHRLLQMPPPLQALAQQVESGLAVGEVHAPMGERTAQVGGEALSFPYRVYYSSDAMTEVTRGLHGDALAMSLCLATRHWDGHVREAAIHDLDLFGRPWAIPFAVQLLGEYVVEIGKIVEAQMAKVGLQPFFEFARENPNFIQTTRRRATSYWACYYRSSYKTLGEYPCYRAVQTICSPP